MSRGLLSPLRVVLLAGACGFAAFMLGFAGFATQATHLPAPIHGAADGIVVLTGGGARLGEAGRLLRQGYGKRLLISGVNPRTGRDDLERLTGLDGSGFQCCVDIGYAARDTIGNAGEARQWASIHRYRRLIVVTASYHMPRSLAELAHALPGIELIAHPVVPREFETAAWLRDATSLRVLVGEYVKYLSACVRLTVARATSPTPAADNAAQADPRVLARQR